MSGKPEGLTVGASVAVLRPGRIVRINRSKSACTNFQRKRLIVKQFGRLIST